MKIRKGSCIASLLYLFSLGGCAFTDYTISQRGRFQAAPAQLAKPTAFTLDVSYVPTLPSQPNAIGVKKNGYGWETAYLNFDTNPQSWMRESIEDALAKAGFVKASSAKGDVVNIGVVVSQVFVEPGVGFWSADLASISVFEVTVTFPKKRKSFQRKFVGKISESAMIWTDGRMEGSLMESIRRCVLEFTQETTALANREAR
jgi:hypothetical protein